MSNTDIQTDAIMSRKPEGPMVGCEDALSFVSSLPESETRDRVLRRMQYEFAREKGRRVKFRKGVHGKKYDSYTCGNCGFVVSVVYTFCPNCGFSIDWGR